jgi:predicted nucleotide-binding protein
MAKRPSRTSQRQPIDPGEPDLVVPRARLEEQLDDQIAKGCQLLDRQVTNDRDLSDAQADYYTWDEYNTTLLRRSFSTSKPAERYSSMGAFVVGGVSTFGEKLDDHRKDVARKIRRLESLKEQLSLYEVADPGETTPPPLPQRSFGQTVFVVHGHDEATKQEVARYLERVSGHTPTILHEQPDRGRTIIEKFEDHAGEAGFAVVLLTADDEGGVRGSDAMKPRARQNVVFELGFFIGALGRSRVAVLYGDGVELPSDISGVLYKPLSGDWKLELARELKAADIEIDLNRVL